MDSAGDLVLATGAGDLRLRRPVIYQEVDGERRPVDGGYVVDGIACGSGSRRGILRARW